MKLKMNNKIGNRNKLYGQSLVEYAIVCGALAFILFVPIKDSASPSEAKTTVKIVIDGFKKAYERFSHAISIPT